MVEARYTHVSVQADGLERAAAFYESVFGLERIPTPDFEEPAQWFRCGDLQLHIVENEAEAPAFNHLALHVSDFEAVYRAVQADEDAGFMALPHVEAGFVEGEPPVYVLPSGAAQLYVKDPDDNLIEVNAPDAGALDRTVVPNVVDRPDIAPPAGEPAPVYMD